MKKNTNPSPQRPKSADPQMPAIVDEASLLSDLRSIIQSAHQRIAVVAYSIQTLLCWHVGRRLLNEYLQGGRAAYGKQILVTVSRELTVESSRVGTFLCPGGQRRLFPRGHKNRAHPTRLLPALAAGLVAMTLPDKPNSRLQAYKLAAAGVALLKKRSKA